MTVPATISRAIRRPFEWALSLVREPALLALWVLMGVALVHAIATLSERYPGWEYQTINYIMDTMNGYLPHMG